MNISSGASAAIVRRIASGTAPGYHFSSLYGPRVKSIVISVQQAYIFALFRAMLAHFDDVLAVASTPRLPWESSVVALGRPSSLRAALISCLLHPLPSAHQRQSPRHFINVRLTACTGASRALCSNNHDYAHRRRRNAAYGACSLLTYQTWQMQPRSRPPSRSVNGDDRADIAALACRHR